MERMAKSSPSPAFLSKDPGRQSPLIADNHQSLSLYFPEHSTNIDILESKGSFHNGVYAEIEW